MRSTHLQHIRVHKLQILCLPASTSTLKLVQTGSFSTWQGPHFRPGNERGQQNQKKNLLQTFKKILEAV